jgi:hypothetical protein
MTVHVDLKQKPQVIFSSASYHNSPISVMKWNSTGKRLVTGDKVRLPGISFHR